MPLYSHSRLNTFENCPLQYRYRYIDRIKRDVQGIEAFMGKLVHEVLEDLYTDLDRARASNAEDYVARFNDLWSRRHDASVRIVRENMTVEDYRAIGARCVDVFFRRHHPFESGEVLGCETRVEFALDEARRYRMLGFIDRLDRADGGAIEIHDYKTGSLPRPGVLRNDRQLTLYEVAVRERFPGVREVRHVWHYLAHDKQFVERRSEADLRRTRLQTIRAIDSVEAAAEFPARRSALCSWCEYRDICPEWEAERAATGEAGAAGRTGAASAPGGTPALDRGGTQYLLFGDAAKR
ncbi:MAG TPA: PD-(D/E)XK nuclease family protein [Candidatus Polarisedimenticolia bacterium]|nr:PD-(D/E)XK nuclease family protein [Candidatus Polarisedimenticolia bacterium]